MKKRSLLVSLIICLVLMSVPVLVHAAESGAEAVVDRTLIKEAAEEENGFYRKVVKPMSLRIADDGTVSVEFGRP